MLAICVTTEAKMQPNEHLDIQATKLNTIRSAVAPEFYVKSPLKALLWYAFDAIWYVLSITGVLFSPNVWLSILFSFSAGTAVAAMFVWAHDAAHGALFSNRRLADMLGTIFMLPALNMYKMWVFGHNRLHHGFTSLTSLDTVWKPLSPLEYSQTPLLKRVMYRLERMPYFCALHYLVNIWWKGMVTFKSDAKHQHFIYDKLKVLSFLTVFSSVAYYFAGFTGVLLAVIVPFLVFNYYIALFVFLHHTNKDNPFFDNKEDWSQSLGQLRCSTTIRASKLSELLTHNILIHTPHHVDPRIPFYHLKGAYAGIKAQYGDYIVEKRLSLPLIFSTFKECKLYDYTVQQWFTYAEGRKWLLTV
jgi:omega-6 fatty acid desaturase (delta-12 desaturase)